MEYESGSNIQTVFSTLSRLKMIASNSSSNKDEGVREDSPPKLSYSQIMSEKISRMLSEATALCEEGDAGLAVAKLTRAIALQPLNPDLFKLRAEAYVLLQNYQTAIVNFQKVVALNSDEDGLINERLGIVHCEYGEALYADEKFSQALNIFEKAMEYRPEDKNVVMRRIGCLLALERYVECMKIVKQEIENDDTNPELFVLRAKLKLLFGDTTAGYYDVCSALDLDPDHKEAGEMKAELEKKALHCKNQAVHHSLSGKKLESLKKISTAIETDPAVAEYHIFRGALYRRMKDFNSAVDDFLIAMDKVSHQQDCEVYKSASRQLVLTYNDFAMECFRQRHFREAVILLNKAIKEEKKEKGLYLNRGDCFYRMNDLLFSLADYQQALELDPSDWDVSCRVSIVCSEIGVEHYSKKRYSDAEAHFTAAIKHNPKVSRFYVCRARTRHMRKDMPGTKEDILAALILDPDNEECISLIARAFPGKSKDDLMHSHDAQVCRQKLEMKFERLSLHGQQHQKKAPSKHSTQTFHHLLGLDLKFANLESDNTEMCNKEVSRNDTVTVFVDPPTTSNSQSSKYKSTRGNTESEERPGNEDILQLNSSVLNQDEFDTGYVEDSEMGVRQWSVLSRPLPELSSDPQCVLPALKECIQEQSFHKKIYYSKKNCTEEVQRVLRSPPELCRPQRLIPISDRSISPRRVSRTKQ